MLISAFPETLTVTLRKEAFIFSETEVYTESLKLLEPSLRMNQFREKQTLELEGERPSVVTYLSSQLPVPEAIQLQTF